MMPAAEIAEVAVGTVLDDMANTAPVDGPVLALVNGMGATPLLELYGFHAEVARVLEARGVPVARALVGNYVTSLDMAGCSVTLCGPTRRCCACGTRRCRRQRCAGAADAVTADEAVLRRR